MKKNYKKIVIPVIAVGAVGAVAIGSRFLLNGNEKDIKVGEITSNAIDSMNSAICGAINGVCDYERGSGDGTNVAVNNGALKVDDSVDTNVKLDKEDFASETGLGGEDLDFYYDTYIDLVDCGDTPEVAMQSILDEINQPGTTSVVNNDKPGSTGNNNSGGNGNSGNGNGGSSSSSNIENDSQNQNDNVYIPSAEEAEANRIDGYGGFDPSTPSDPLTDEERAAEEAAMDGLHGY